MHSTKLDNWHKARAKQRQKCHQEQVLTLVFQGKSTVASAWRDSGLSWAEFLPSATEVNFFQVMFATMWSYSDAIDFPHFLNIILQVDQFVADNSVEWTLTSTAPASTSNTSAADQRPAKLQKQDIEKELARVLRWYYCPDGFSDKLACHPLYMTFNISYSRESDAIKKNEPVIDWLDANIGRVSIKILLLTSYSQQVSL